MCNETLALSPKNSHNDFRTVSDHEFSNDVSRCLCYVINRNSFLKWMECSIAIVYYSMLSCIVEMY